MRTLLIPLLLAAVTASAAKPEKMIVVVRTTDKVIVDFTCVGPDGNMGSNALFKSTVADRGQFHWHVVGGTAPYTLVKDETNSGYGGCITVRDANGQEATGCGVIGVVHKLRRVNCNINNQPQEGSRKNSIYAVPPSKKDTCTVPIKCNPHSFAPPVVEPSGRTPRTSTPLDKVRTEGNDDTPIKKLSVRHAVVKEPAPPRRPEPPVDSDPVIEKGNRATHVPSSRPGTRNQRVQRNADSSTPRPSVRHSVSYTSRPAPARVSPRPSSVNGVQRVSPRSY